MRLKYKSALNTLAAATVAAVVVGVTAMPASAACTRLGFSVNDYGKDGPTKDAKDLLDKYIAKKMAERGVTKYTTGKKDVTCELFLDVLLFDEHTCKAEATVCWGGNTPEAAKSESAAAPAASGDAVAVKPEAAAATAN